MYLELIIFVTNLAMVIPLVIFYFRPPKNINALYGYRTKRSSKNIDNWRFAQKYSSRIGIKFHLIVLLVQIIMLATMDIKKYILIIVGAFLIGLLISCILMFYFTELALKKHEK